MKGFISKSDSLIEESNENSKKSTPKNSLLGTPRKKNSTEKLIEDLKVKNDEQNILIKKNCYKK